jgi:hypothetical protein
MQLLRAVWGHEFSGERTGDEPANSLSLLRHLPN